MENPFILTHLLYIFHKYNIYYFIFFMIISPKFLNIFLHFLGRGGDHI